MRNIILTILLSVSLVNGHATDKDEGPVTIENWSTVIKSTNGVTITQDFEVKEGAGFEIRVVN